MATDLSVLQYKPPTGPTPLEQAGQFANLQAMAGQRQLQSQQLQLGQQQIDQTKAINDAYAGALVPGVNGGPPTFDTDKLQGALATGGHGSAIPTVMKGINENAKTANEIAAGRTKLATDQADYGGSVANVVRQAGYDPNVMTLQIQHALTSKAVDPSVGAPMLQQLQQAQAADAQNGTQTARQLTQQLADQLISGSPAQQKLANEAKTAQGSADRGTAATGELTLNTAKDTAAKALLANKTALTNYALASPEQKAVALGALSPDLQKQVQGLSPDRVLELAATPAEVLANRRAEALAAEAKVRDAQTATNEGINQSIARAHLGIAQQEFNLKKNAAGVAADPYGSLSPAMRPIADAIGTGDVSLAQLSRFPAQVKETLLAAALQQHKGFTAGTFDTKQSFLNADKPESQKLQTVGRIVAHLKDFESDSGELGNSPLMAVGLGNLTGAQKKFHNDAHAIAAETEKLFAGGVGTEGQTKAWIDGLTSSIASVRQTSVDGLSQLIGGQFGAMNQAYKAATGQDLPLERFTNVNTRKWMTDKKIDVRGDGGTIDTTPPGATPAGGAGTTPSAAAANSPAQPRPLAAKFQQTATGPGGVGIGSNDGVTWFDLKTGQRFK